MTPRPVSPPLCQAFPGLDPATDLETSAPSPAYNCVAWAAGEDSRFWWPRPMALGYYWPEGVARETTLQAFQAAFATLGYEPCSLDALEDGYEKISLFTGATGIPTHVARQLQNGRWTSKLGSEEDIEHELRALEGPVYGSLKVVMRRLGA